MVRSMIETGTIEIPLYQCASSREVPEESSENYGVCGPQPNPLRTISSSNGNGSGTGSGSGIGVSIPHNMEADTPARLWTLHGWNGPKNNTDCKTQDKQHKGELRMSESDLYSGSGSGSNLNNQQKEEERKQRWNKTKWIGYHRLGKEEPSPPEAWEDAETRASVYNVDSKEKSTRTASETKDRNSRALARAGTGSDPMFVSLSNFCTRKANRPGIPESKASSDSLHTIL